MNDHVVTSMQHILLGIFCRFNILLFDIITRMANSWDILHDAFRRAVLDAALPNERKAHFAHHNRYLIVCRD